ncbi:MAG: GldG family protein [Gammaproteobacteria bacterium]|nr:GldG family protein [Gammaproteobacteria bacterium]
MKIKSWQAQHIRFVALLFGIFILVGFLAVRYDRSIDVTLSHRHALSESSIEVVKQLTEPMKVTAFVRGNPKVKKLIIRLLAKYQQYAEINLIFKNPDNAIDLVREYGIDRDGELVFEYQGRRAYSADLSETSMTKAIYQVLGSSVRKILFVTGHGERGGSKAQSDYSALFKRLREADMKVGQVDLKIAKTVPNDVDLLVVADAQIEFTDAENQKIKNYLANGGSLLWLAEPNSARLPALVSELAVSTGQGTLINRSAKKYSMKNSPDYIVIEPQKTDMPILEGINTMLMFVQSAPLQILPTDAQSNWQILPLLPVADESFIKTDSTISKAPTPTLLGLLLVSTNVEREQKVVVVGDADFLSNQFIGFGQNSDFAMNIFTYLSAPKDVFVRIEQPMPPAVIISSTELGYLALVFIVVIPLLILLLGLFIRYRFRRGS